MLDLGTTVARGVQLGFGVLQRLLQFTQALGQLLEDVGRLFQRAALVFQRGDLQSRRWPSPALQTA